MDSRHFLTPLFDPQRVLLVTPRDGAPDWAGPLAERLAPLGERVVLHRLDTRRGPPAGPFDLALLAVAGPAVDAALAAATSAGARSVLVMADPPDPEAGARWAAQARRDGIRLLGPRSAGFVRPHDGLCAGNLPGMPTAGDVALVSQSGALAAAMLEQAVEAGTGFSLVLSLGDEPDVDVAEVLDFLAFDTRTRAVVLYLDTVHDARSFMSALRLLATAKPVIVLKGHRHDGPGRRSLTHSGTLGGADAVYDAALRRAGAIRIQIFVQVAHAARYLSHRAGHVGRRLAVLSQGKGPAILAADQGIADGLRLPSPSAATLERLQALGVTGANPLDLTGLPPDRVGPALRALADDERVDAVLVILTPHRAPGLAAQAEAIVAQAPTLEKPLLVCLLGGSRIKSLAPRFEAAGIPAYDSPEAAVNAYANLATFHQNQELLLQVPRPLSELGTPDLSAARAIVARALADRTRLLDEAASKSLLAAFGIPVVDTRVAASADEACAQAAAIGWPVAMKILSPDIPHKSDAGGVALDVRGPDELRARHAEMMAAVADAQPQARVLGVTVQAMHRTRHGRELYVGVFRDALWGPVIAFGAGGTRVELLRDATLEFAPLNRFLVRRMIERTRVAATLAARPGLPAVEMEAIERVLLRVSEMVCELPELLEMDINPVIADEHGAVAVDARIVVEPVPAGRAPYAHLAIEPYPARLEREHATPDGQAYRIRPIEPEDAEGLQTFMHELSPQSRYYRFVSTLSELPPRMLVRFTQIDYAREVALLATERRPDGPPGPAGEHIIGVVRYMLNPDRASCEFAISVLDDWQGKGLGSTLMRAIVAIARERGLESVEGYVMASNRPMLGLMRHLGFKVRTDPEDPEMCRVLMPLQ